jgi:hypothetical protein
MLEHHRLSAGNTSFSFETDKLVSTLEEDERKTALTELRGDALWLSFLFSKCHFQG